MSHLSQLKPIVTKRKKRLGRGVGSGAGAKSGRGTTRHQKARESISLSFEGGQGRMVKRFPLMRGKNKNKSIKPPVRALSSEILNMFDDGAEVTYEFLLEKQVIDPSDLRVKFVGKHEVKKKLTVALPVSQSVKQAIEKAGGQINA